MTVAAAAVALLAWRAAAFDPPSTSVSAGESVVVPSYLLLAPLIAWFGGIALAVRASVALLARLRLPAAPRFGSPVAGTLVRSLRRRSRSLGTGIAGVGLVVAFGTALALFSSTYDRAKAADARFVVGADLRVVPSALSPRSHPPSYAGRLRVAGVEEVTAVVSQARQRRADRPERPGSSHADGDRAVRLRARDGLGGGAAEPATAGRARECRSGRRAGDRGGRGRQGAPRTRDEAPDARDVSCGRPVRAPPGLPERHRRRREPPRLCGGDARERGRQLPRPRRRRQRRRVWHGRRPRCDPVPGRRTRSTSRRGPRRSTRISRA